MPISDELAALIRRAERATANARRLLADNERWRRYAERQLDVMYELSSEFRRSAVRHPPIPPRPRAGDTRPAARSTRGAAPTPPRSA